MNRNFLAVIGLVVALAVIGAVVLLDEESPSASLAESTAPVALDQPPAALTTDVAPAEVDRLSSGAERRLDVAEPGALNSGAERGGTEAKVATAALVGRVTYEVSGEPVAGLLVEPQFADELSVEPSRAITDENGRYVFAVSGVSTLTAMVALPGADTPRQQASFDLVLSPDEDTVADFAVVLGVFLSGQVLDLDGRAVRGAGVHGWTGEQYTFLAGEMPEPEQTVLCDANGNYRLGGLGGSWMLAPFAEGYSAHHRVQGSQITGATLDDVGLVLSPSRSLRGRVLGTGAQPVPGAKVSASVQLQGAAETLTVNQNVYLLGPPSVKGEADAQGRFDLPGLAGRDYKVAVSAATYPKWMGEHGPGDEELAVQLEAGLSLAGRVLSFAGEPVVGAEVQLVPEGTFRSSKSRAVATDEQGRFELLGLEPATNAYLSVGADGFAVHVEQPVAVKAGGQAELTVVLSPSLSLAGRVIDAEGNPVSSATVSIEGDRVIDLGNITMSPLWTWERSFGISRQRTDEDGRFAFDALYDGEYTVEANDRASDVRAELQARAGSESLEIVLDPSVVTGVTLTGDARDLTTGLLVPKFSVTPMIPSGNGGMSGSGTQFDDQQEPWRITGLAPGPMQVNATAQGYAPWSGELVDYVEGEHRIDIAFVPTRTVVFSVLDEERQPLEAKLTFEDSDGRQLMVEMGMGSRSSALETDATGQGRAAGLPAQPITVTVTKGWFSGEREYAVDLTHQPSGPIELIYGDVDEQTVMVLVLTGSPNDPSVLQITDLSDATAGQILQDELTSGALRPLTSPVSITAMDDDGEEVATQRFNPASGNPEGTASPAGQGGFMTTMMLPIKALNISVSAEGYETASRSWVPANGEGPGVVVLLLAAK